MKFHRKKKVIYLAVLFIFILGSNTFPVQSVKAGMTSTLPRIVQVSAGSGHVLGVGTDGTLWAWGDNNSGDLGDGTYISRSTPVQVGGEHNWLTVAAGDHFSAAVKKDGSLWLWGTNIKNRYINGQPAIINRNTPLRFGKDNDWSKISAGPAGLAAIRKDGTIWEFGLNVLPGVISNGRLNNDKDWKDISVGDSGILALKKDGSLWAMGSVVPSDKNTGGLIRVGNDRDFDQIAASYYSVVRKKDKTVWSLKWDTNSNNIRLDQVVEIPTSTQITGEFVSGILDEEGSVWKWDTGYDEYEKIDCPEKLTAIDDGGDFGVALDENGIPWTYGTNEWGQRGNGSSESMFVPNYLDDTTKAVKFADWDTYTLRKDGSLSLTNSLRNISDRPLGTETDWSSIEAARGELYALKEDGSLWSYRPGDQAPSGLPASTASDLEPFQPGTYWKSIKMNDLGNVVGLKKDGTLWFWGSDPWQMILKGSSSSEHYQPIQLGPDSNWQSFSMFNSSILAIKQNGTLWALGNNHQGQLGIKSNSSAARVAAFTKVGNFSDWVQAEVGATTSVGLRKDGSLWQWGYGFLGNITRNPVISPITPISRTKDWAKIWNTGSSAFAMKKDGSLWGWGNNGYGELGTGSANGRRNLPA